MRLCDLVINKRLPKDANGEMTIELISRSMITGKLVSFVDLTGTDDEFENFIDRIRRTVQR